ncbi:hypothetical protein PLICRDRAFT_178068 [Plicaturopsis crispa FD-325 SS-3]|nr:hypothetical protein PLICRDRAFT_178068 [Plicaturopsis crispa FD-325 SS-3]
MFLIPAPHPPPSPSVAAPLPAHGPRHPHANADAPSARPPALPSHDIHDHPHLRCLQGPHRRAHAPTADACAPRRTSRSHFSHPPDLD